MNNKTYVEPLVYSVDQAAKVLDVSKPTLYKLIHQDDFPSFKIGNRMLISVEGLQDWVRSQVQPPVATN